MDGNELTVGKSSALRTARIKSIPDIDLYKVFIANKPNISANTEMLTRLSVKLDYIDDIKERIDEINNYIREYITNFFEKYMTIINDVITENNKISMDIVNGFYGENYELANLVILIKSHVSAEAMAKYNVNDNIRALHDSIAAPLYTSIRGMKRNEDNYNLLGYTQELEGKYKHLLHFKKNVVEELGVVAMRLNSTGVEISEILSIMH